MILLDQNILYSEFVNPILVGLFCLEYVVVGGGVKTGTVIVQHTCQSKMSSFYSGVFLSYCKILCIFAVIPMI